MISLTTTKTGCHILQELGFFPSNTQDPPVFTPVPRELHDLITIAPIPQNVHPEYNPGRRLARATAFLKRIKKAHNVAFWMPPPTDTTEHSPR